MSTSPIAGVLVHVADISEGLAWYERAFPHAARRRIDEPLPIEYLAIGDVMLEIVPADKKVASGAAGSVVYWRVEHFEAAVAHFESLGAPLYRGPLAIENGQQMGQVRDPWGNCIGLRG
ncbi:MAG: glyoxalase/bleomycin resistance/dioxygenase family protein [Verrucomicrobiaceae bacterium]|nr:MAG: glyoxalase/bleomycin resistance/dioxygenase family protein [Verrucomicrobiaceae bacterium]